MTSKSRAGNKNTIYDEIQVHDPTVGVNIE